MCARAAHEARFRARRRALLAGLIAWPAFPAPAEPLRRVLFIGNSFTHQHDVPARVAALAEAEGRPLVRHAILRNGATLDGHLGRERVRHDLALGWEAVVLQEFSTAALDGEGRHRSARAVTEAMRLAPRASFVFFVPWPRAPGHPLYARPPRPGHLAPRGPQEMARATMAHARAIAREVGPRLRVAPVAGAWTRAMSEGARLHAADGYHANPRGAALAAAVLWGTLAPLLP